MIPIPELLFRPILVERKKKEVLMVVNDNKPNESQAGLRCKERWRK